MFKMHNHRRAKTRGTYLTSTMTCMFVALVFGLAAPMSASAEKAPIFTGLLSNKAVGGYDPVSYFNGDPQQGDSAFSTIWKGAEFRFSNQANLDAFLADPESFAPQYGGYCAWAVSQGYTAKGDPKHWKIVNGRLYLNYNKDVQARWAKDIPGQIASADENWPEVLK